MLRVRVEEAVWVLDFSVWGVHLKLISIVLNLTQITRLLLSFNRSLIYYFCLISWRWWAYVLLLLFTFKLVRRKFIQELFFYLSRPKRWCKAYSSSVCHGWINWWHCLLLSWGVGRQDTGIEIDIILNGTLAHFFVAISLPKGRFSLGSQRMVQVFLGICWRWQELANEGSTCRGEHTTLHSGRQIGLGIWWVNSV